MAAADEWKAVEELHRLYDLHPKQQVVHNVRSSASAEETESSGGGI
jgi:hypothetical protein